MRMVSVQREPGSALQENCLTARTTPIALGPTHTCLRACSHQRLQQAQRRLCPLERNVPGGRGRARPGLGGRGCERAQLLELELLPARLQQRGRRRKFVQGWFTNQRHKKPFSCLSSSSCLGGLTAVQHRKGSFEDNWPAGVTTSIWFLSEQAHEMRGGSLRGAAVRQVGGRGSLSFSVWLRSDHRRSLNCATPCRGFLQWGVLSRHEGLGDSKPSCKGASVARVCTVVSLYCARGPTS